MRERTIIACVAAFIAIDINEAVAGKTTKSVQRSTTERTRRLIAPHLYYLPGYVAAEQYVRGNADNHLESEHRFKILQQQRQLQQYYHQATESDDNTEAPKYNADAPKYSIEAPKYNTVAPMYNMEAPKYNTEAPNFRYVYVNPTTPYEYTTRPPLPRTATYAIEEPQEPFYLQFRYADLKKAPTTSAKSFYSATPPAPAHKVLTFSPPIKYDGGVGGSGGGMSIVKSEEYQLIEPLKSSSLADLKNLDLMKTLPERITPGNIKESIKTLSYILEVLRKADSLQTQKDDLLEGLRKPQEFHHPSLLLPPPPPPVSHPPKYQIGNPVTAQQQSGTPGRPGLDYPIYSVIPETNFHCGKQRYKGFFADTETKCQVWHYCDFNGGQASFLCPNGTIFSQSALTCDWWFNVRCSSTPQLYVLNESLYKYIIPQKPSFPEDFSGPLVDKYLTEKFEQQMERERERERSYEEYPAMNQTAAAEKVVVGEHAEGKMDGEKK